MAEADTSTQQQASQGDSQAQAAALQAAASAAASQSTQATTQATEAPKRPDGLGDAFWDDKAGVKLPDLIKAHGELTALKAGLDAKAAAIPETADKYETVLPKDFALPDGWSINPADPVWKAGREYAKANGLSQEQFSGLAKLYVEGQLSQRAAQDAEIKAATDARDKALGANGAARVEALNTWFKSAFDEKTAAQLASALFTPDIVSAFEKMQLGLAKQGLTGFSATGRVEGRTDGKPENWDTMSAVDRHTWNLIQKSEARKSSRS